MEFYLNSTNLNGALWFSRTNQLQIMAYKTDLLKAQIFKMIQDSDNTLSYG